MDTLRDRPHFVLWLCELSKLITRVRSQRCEVPGRHIRSRNRWTFAGDEAGGGTGLLRVGTLSLTFNVSVQAKSILPRTQVDNPEMFTNGLPSVTRRERGSSVLLCESECNTNEKQNEKAMTTRANHNLVKEGAIEAKARDLVAVRASQL